MHYQLLTSTKFELFRNQDKLFGSKVLYYLGVLCYSLKHFTVFMGFFFFSSDSVKKALLKLWVNIKNGWLLSFTLPPSHSKQSLLISFLIMLLSPFHFSQQSLFLDFYLSALNVFACIFPYADWFGCIHTCISNVPIIIIPWDLDNRVKDVKKKTFPWMQH